MPAKAYTRRAGQADDRITTEAFAAFDRFEQVGVRPVGELQIDRQRRVEVGQDLAHDRDAGVAVSGLLLELFGRGHAVVSLEDEGAVAMAIGHHRQSRPMPAARKFGIARGIIGARFMRLLYRLGASDATRRVSRSEGTVGQVHPQLRRHAANAEVHRLHRFAIEVERERLRGLDLQRLQPRLHGVAGECGVAPFADHRGHRRDQLARQRRNDGQVEAARRRCARPDTARGHRRPACRCRCPGR